MPSYIMPHETISKTTGYKWLLKVSEELVKKYAFGTSEIATLVKQTDDLHQALGKHFCCRFDDCTQTYVHHSWRVK